MRRLRTDGSFWLCLLINLLLNWEGSIPAWILLVLHFVFGLSVKWFWIALGGWIGLVLLTMLIWGWVCGWADKCGNTPDPPKKNVNPYSVGQQKHRD